MSEFFEYGEREIEHLKKRDKKLGAAIELIGRINRPVTPGLFSSLVRSIIGQQIATRAQETICARVLESLGEVTPESVCECGRAEFQKFGVSHRKADYILDFAEKVRAGEFDIDALPSMTDEQVVASLSSLRGVGVWTAEMLMLFSMQRPDILSFGDLAIHRGMRMLYRRRAIDRELFERYRKRYSPCGSVASLYLWAIAGGALPELYDPGAK